MQNLSRLTKGLSIAILLNVAMPVFAESAPVYDADSMPSQFDSGSSSDQDQGQDLPPPPPPGQEGAYVPPQYPTVSSTPPPSNNNSNISSGSIEQRLRRAEQQINNIQTSDSVTRLDSLQGQVQSLRGQVEDLTHQLQQMQNQQKAMYSDIEKRLTQQPTSAAKSVQVAADTSVATPPSTDATAAANAASANQANKRKNQKTTVNAGASSVQDQPNVAEEQQIYQTAYNLIKAKKYDDAVGTLQGMLKKYPSGQFASNAHYWLGELFGLMGKNDKALLEFDTVVKTYPDSPRISDAQLKVGLIYASQSKWTDAKSAFKRVINRYPGTASARLAAEHLKEIRQAGN